MNQDMGWIQQLTGWPVPDWVAWIGVGIIVVLIIIFVLYGFFSELHKK
ncbi:MAG: hypothetical protein LBM21_00760 [Coriobacteriales bacterium]|jgi:uncharacterized protein involved in cysteine biosynthesis|nr:hypothetical protein [Coriobacteriales bacterium]